MACGYGSINSLFVPAVILMYRALLRARLIWRVVWSSRSTLLAVHANTPCRLCEDDARAMIERSNPP